MKILGQSKRFMWLGAVPAQYSNSSVYLSIANSVIMLTVLWQTGFGHTLQRYISWASLPLFLLAGLTGYAGVIFLDHKFVQPGRAAYIANQLFKHQGASSDLFGTKNGRHKEK